MNLSEYIDPKLNRINFHARNKKQALLKIADIACHSPLLKNETAEHIFNLLSEREEMVSTGIGKGVAIPHVRLSTLEDFLIFVLIAPDGVEFDALDKKRVTMFFVVFAPDNKVNEHLKLLAGIANTLVRGGLKNELLKTRTPGILHEVLVRNFSGNDNQGQRDNSRNRLLLVVLYYEEFLNDILEYLIDMNVEGATITSSEGMAAHISTIPLFASFMGFMREDQKMSRTIMAVIPQDAESEIIRGIEVITGDLEKTRGAMIMTLDIAFSKGTMNML
jgi:nitrogen PTS system EIIA component